MKREVIRTADGSHTISIPELNVTYHSRHGAIQESLHVFIEAGLHHLLDRMEQPGAIRIFEMGFGTGLNAFLTALEAEQKQRKMHYTAVEPYPLAPEEASPLNYTETLQHNAVFSSLHQCPWHEDVLITGHFTLRKEKTSLANFSTTQPFNLIYYDAFAPAAQPELWTREVFEKLYGMLASRGILVTYCSKGDVRRALMAAGFTVTKLPGPPGKREMLRGEKAD
jgi:tRNA U34 5-methylaminomethyl-2-thiouridine-forming methyltransferase MnmC